MRVAAQVLTWATRHNRNSGKIPTDVSILSVVILSIALDRYWLFFIWFFYTTSHLMQQEWDAGVVEDVAFPVMLPKQPKGKIKNKEIHQNEFRIILTLTFNSCMQLLVDTSSVFVLISFFCKYICLLKSEYICIIWYSMIHFNDISLSGLFFMPRFYGIAFIVHLYLHFLYTVIWYQVFFSNTNNSMVSSIISI